jgi:hypothetical protein
MVISTKIPIVFRAAGGKECCRSYYLPTGLVDRTKLCANCKKLAHSWDRTPDGKKRVLTAENPVNVAREKEDDMRKFGIYKSPVPVNGRLPGESGYQPSVVNSATTNSAAPQTSIRELAEWVRSQNAKEVKVNNEVKPARRNDPWGIQAKEEEKRQDNEKRLSANGRRKLPNPWRLPED